MTQNSFSESARARRLDRDDEMRILPSLGECINHGLIGA